MGMFNFYDEQAKTQASPQETGMAYAKLSPGRGSVALAGQAGQMMSQGAMQGLGMKTPAQEKQEALMAIQAQFPNPQTAQEFRQIGNALMNIDPDRAKMAFDQAENLKPSATSSTMTTAMKDIRDIAKYQLGCDFNDPECAKKSNQLYIDRKRQTAGEKGAGQYEKGQADSFIKEQDRIYDASDKSDGQLATINQSITMLNEGLWTGPGGDFVTFGKQLASTFGFAEPDWAAGAEQFKVNTMKSVMAWIAQTKGAISEKEMKLFAAAAPGLSKTEAGNRLILNTMREAALYQRNLESEYNTWVAATDKPNLIKWRAHKRNWNKTNGIKAPTGAQIKAAMNGTTSPPSVSASKTGAITIEVVE